MTLLSGTDRYHHQPTTLPDIDSVYVSHTTIDATVWSPGPSRHGRIVFVFRGFFLGGGGGDAEV